jgi:hypothetical protein
MKMCVCVCVCVCKHKYINQEHSNKKIA